MEALEKDVDKSIFMARGWYKKIFGRKVRMLLPIGVGQCVYVNELSRAVLVFETDMVTTASYIKLVP